jgi:hypothetical protein
MSSGLIKNVMIISTNNNTLNKTSDETDEENELGQKVIYIILIILLIFMCLFVYNLIKCYLPVWLGNKKSKKQQNEDNPLYNLEAIDDHTV